MKIPEQVALSLLVAQFGVQQQYGPAGTALVVAAGCLPDVDGLSRLGGWQAHRTWHGVAAHGLPVTLAAPALLALLGSEGLALGPFFPLWVWLQASLLTHLVTDMLVSLWPVRPLWPVSSWTCGLGLVARNDLVPGLILWGAAVAALGMPELAPVMAGVGIGGLALYITWRAARPRPRAARSAERMPRFWQGFTFSGWLRLLVRNQFAVSPSRWYVALVVTFVSPLNSVLWLLKCALYDWRVGRGPIRAAPVFIIGHWRTGTTLLHEFLVLDDRHAFPTTYECLAPNHFLLTESWLPRVLWFLMPSRRPMDNMAAGWDRPQEDEFALCMMGQPSPYLTIAFPNHPPQDQAALDLEALPPRALAKWKRALLWFLRQVSFKRPGKRLVLKSPTHTCRIRVLLEMFPDARFVHIVRDPYVVFSSTVNLWKALYETHGLQRPTFAGLEEYVFRTFAHLYERLEATRGLIDPARFREVRFEDLVRDPVGQMRTLYEGLGLGDFERVLPRLRSYLADLDGYQTNRYEQTPEVRAEIERRWGDIIRRYGYETPARPPTR